MLHKVKPVKNKISTNRNAFTVVAVILLFLYCATLVLSLLWGFINSLRTQMQFDQNLFGFPKSFIKDGLSNYISAFTELSVTVTSLTGGTREAYMWELFLNTILYSVGCTFFATIVPCITAYAVAKYRFPGRNLIYSVVIVAMILPIVGSLPSEMQVVRAIGFYNNLVGIWILKGTFLGMYFLVFYAAFKSLSWEYAEAAFIDGASHFKVMLKIMLPLVAPTILAVGLLMFIGFWNEYQTQLLYLPSMPSVSYALWQIMLKGGSQSGAGSKIPVQFAASMLVSLPMVIVFIVFKDKLIGNIAVGGIKG